MATNFRTGASYLTSSGAIITIVDRTDKLVLGDDGFWRRDSSGIFCGNTYVAESCYDLIPNSSREAAKRKKKS